MRRHLLSLGSAHFVIALGLMGAKTKSESALDARMSRSFDVNIPSACDGRERGAGTTYFANGPRPGRRARGGQRGR